MISEKKCSKCGEELPIANFYYGLSWCKKCSCEASRKWYTANPEKARAWYHANCEKVRAQAREWYHANREKARANNHKRRARKRGATIGKVDFKALFIRDKGICQICQKPVSKKEWHADHVIPLSKGGEHSMRNLQVTHARCNLSKGARQTTLF